ncbi:MAG: delta(1)-pyrroline-2-carboxylate reductase family protein, partial [Burkholderiaceae bacterium]
MTQASIPWHQLLTEIQLVLIEDSHGLIQKPPRHALPLKDDGVLLVMPIAGPDIAAVKSISVCPLNLTKGLPAIQGEILVFDAVSGAVLATLDGALITAQRTAAVSTLAAQLAAPNPAGDLLIIGAGVQGKNHVEAFHILFGTQRVWVQSKSMASAVALVEYAKNLGIDAHYLPPNSPYPTSIQNIATCTPAHEVVLAHLQNLDFNNLFITAIGSFKAHLAEISVD